MKGLLFFALTVIPSLVVAQPSDHVRFLLPISGNTAGLQGTSWRTDVLVHNGNAAPLTVPPIFAMPYSTTGVLFFPQANPAVFIDVPSALADDVAFRMRVHDEAHDAESAGIEIPGIPDSAFAPSTIVAGVPTDARFRTMLRLYADSAADQVATLSLRDESTGALLDRRPVSLSLGSASAPAYAQVALDPIILPLAPAHPVRAEIAASVPVWAFVSITNNVTQQVTALLGHRGLLPPPSALAVGHWGNDQGTCVEVSDPLVIITSGCALGRFVPPATISSDGRFEADGFWLIEAGPASANDRGGAPAHFSGVVQGTTLTLTVRYNGATFDIAVQLGSTARCIGNACV